jgi:hypothetical protein
LAENLNFAQRFHGLPRPPLKRVHKFTKVGPNVAITLLKFDPTIFVKAKRLSRIWREEVQEAVDDYCNRFENQFVANYFEHIFFKKAFSWSKPISFCGKKGLRLDRVFSCEIVPNGKFFEIFKQPAVTYTIAAKYKLYGDRQIYHIEFKFDTQKCTENQHKSGGAPKRETWIHKDAQSREIYTQPIQPISEGDSIEFSVTVANLSGFLEWLEWEPCHITEAPNVSALTYDKDLIKSLFFRHTSQKIFCDLNRICELEDATVEWYEEKYYQRQELFDLTFM